VLAELEGEAVAVEGEEALQERLGQLDLALTWLWKVHGLDYYGGRELLLEADYLDRAAAARTLRGPRPEEGEEQDEDEGERHAWAGCCAGGRAGGGRQQGGAKGYKQRRWHVSPVIEGQGL
jgi:hypothetical protein